MGQRALWLLALVWLGAIYSTLYIARPAAEFLRERNLLALTIWSIVALLGAAVLAWAVRRRPTPAGWAVLLVGAVLLLTATASVSPVEVRLHFVEYGVLGAVFYLALRARGSRAAALLAIALTGAAGWIDEGIQYLLPGRWYGVEDVIINLVAGAITVLTMALFQRVQPAAAGS